MFNRVSLEMSLKPFCDATPEKRRAVCREMFLQWLPICRHASEVDIMLWTADGSEILDYRGDLDAELEWARYIGGANRLDMFKNEERSHDPDDNDLQGIGGHGSSVDPEHLGLHSRSYLYRENPPVLTYRWLRDLTTDLKTIGRETLGVPIRVGDTFDPGPEFAKSPFKYERHREICTGGILFGNTFISCDAVLNADDVSYAAFPEGIPAGTSIGTFVGRQLKKLNDDMGFDYVWLSNGFGFGRNTWSYDGVLFDGRKFMPEEAAMCRERILQFWHDFRGEIGEMPVRTRGTNLTTGIDLASEGLPLAEIYKLEGNLLEPPVNSPWAALDGDFGLELAGWMSHIAELPGDDFPFRFYTHDPWWMNSPWLDRYQRRPHDIYLPLSVGRMRADGSIQTPMTLSILSVDDSRGGMPQQVPVDVASHIFRSRENPPDQAGPVLWVYPFREYHEMTFGDDPQLKRVYFGDWYVRGAINQGLPVNTVVSTDNLLKMAVEKPATVSKSIWLTPVPAAGSTLHAALLQHVARGGKALIYGPIDEDDTTLLELLSLAPAPAPGIGEFDLASSWELPAGPQRLLHGDLFSAGPLTLAPVARDDVAHRATATRDGVTYALAAAVAAPAWQGGQLIWLRGGVSTDESRLGRQLPPSVPTRFFPAEALAVHALAELGVTLLHNIAVSGTKPPLHTISRARNGWYFSGYNPQGVSQIRLRLPYGAPLLNGQRATINQQGELSWANPPAWWHAECRLFAAKSDPATIVCDELPSISSNVERRIVLQGLNESVIRFFPVTGTEERVRILRDPAFPYLIGDFLTPRRIETDDGLMLEVGPLSGSVIFFW